MLVAIAMSEMGHSDDQRLVGGPGTPYPGFCGGAGAEDNVVPVSDEEDPRSTMTGVSSGPMSPLDYVAQNLQCRLGNPRNRCFDNSAFRLWAWAGSFLEGPKLWNKTSTAAVVAALGEDDIVHLPNLEGLGPLWRKFDDQFQDDASHFLQEMVNLADSARVIQSYHQVDFRQAVRQKKAFPIHLIYPADHGPEDLENLIAEWAKTQEGQVFDGHGLWVGQIGRYTKANGEWTKHHRPLQVPSIFNLPVTYDGNETRTKQYSVIGYLCHSGNEHQRGHFFAVFMYRGLSWLVDDGAFPRPTAQLPEEMKQQMWAVPSEQLLEQLNQHQKKMPRRDQF